MSQVTEFLTREELPPSRNRRSPLRRIVLVLALGLIGVGIVAFVNFSRSLGYVAEAKGEGTGSVTVQIAAGDSLTVMGVKLSEAGVVGTADEFVLAAESDSRSGSIGPGTYTLRLGMSGGAALALMLTPSSHQVQKLVIPEGLTAAETIAEAADATGIPVAEFERVLNSPGILDELGLPTWAEGRADGLLYPATYDLGTGITAEDVIGAMLRRFDQAATSVGLEAEAQKAGLTPYQVVTIASLVQAEVWPDDFGRASRVILNRLDQGIPLQLCSTVNFVLGTSAVILTEDQMKVDSPYNTYRNKGLPPTPTVSPGVDALEGALFPEPGSWIYFVTVDPDSGNTRFTASYDEFLTFKDELRANLAKKDAAQSASSSAEPIASAEPGE